MPVFSAHLNDYSALRIADRLRASRQTCRMSLRELSARAGMSAAKLSNLETGKSSPSLRDINDIASALGVSLATVIPASHQQPYLLTRNGERLAHADAPPGHDHGTPARTPVFRPLARPFVGRHMDPHVLEFPPGPVAPVIVDALYEQFLFVLTGVVDLSRGAEGSATGERLYAGDSLSLRALEPCAISSASSEPARVLVVACALPGMVSPAEDRDVTHADLAERPHPRNLNQVIGSRISLFRRSRGWNQQELAALAGVRARQLALIERGDTETDLEFLFRLSLVFTCPMEYFFGPAVAAGPPLAIQRKAQTERAAPRQRRSTAAATESSFYRPLVAGHSCGDMYPYYVQFLPSTASTRSSNQHHGEEFVYVLAGEVELIAYSGKTRMNEIVRPGDCVYLDSGAPHNLRPSAVNPYATTTAEVVTVFWTPHGEESLFAEMRDE